MEEEASWLPDCATTDTFEPGSFSEDDKQVVDLIFPDDLLERILARLPIASIIRAGCVCKKWHETVKSGRFLWNSSQLVSHKPWYFMFSSSEIPIGYAYDQLYVCNSITKCCKHLEEPPGFQVS